MAHSADLPAPEAADQPDPAEGERSLSKKSPSEERRGLRLEVVIQFIRALASPEPAAAAEAAEPARPQAAEEAAEAPSPEEAAAEHLRRRGA